MIHVIGASIAYGANDASEADHMPDGIDVMPSGIDATNVQNFQFF
jgi:hypothetical protein